MSSGTNIPDSTAPFGSGDAPYLNAANKPSIKNTIGGLPQLSPAGNLIGLGLNAGVLYWAWGKGGWYRLIVVVTVLNSLYFVGKLEQQV
jgi:hypothetical protein